MDGHTCMNIPVVVTSLSLTTPCIVKMLRPTGGVTIATSIAIVEKIPNHKGSTPILTTIGKKMGNVRTNMATLRIRHPIIK
jgi:hypothetical protein